MGKIKNVRNFDANAFKFNDKEVEYIDPQQRIAMEVIYEAIVDAGM